MSGGVTDGTEKRTHKHTHTQSRKRMRLKNCTQKHHTGANDGSERSSEFPFFSIFRMTAKTRKDFPHQTSAAATPTQTHTHANKHTRTHIMHHEKVGIDFSWMTSTNTKTVVTAHVWSRRVQQYDGMDNSRDMGLETNASSANSENVYMPYQTVGEESKNRQDEDQTKRNLSVVNRGDDR